MLTELFENINKPYEQLTEDGCILYPDQCHFLCKISIISLISSLYALYKDYYELAVIPFGVFLTSIIYWYKPIPNSWRQTLDVTYVKFAVFYNIIRAYNSEYYILYYITAIIGLCFYPLGIYLYNKKMYWESTYAHSMGHIIANISNFILYTGYVIPFTTYVDYFNSLFTTQLILDECNPLIHLENI
jgi:hypothetical protein